MTSSLSTNKICAVIPFFNELSFLPIITPRVLEHTDYIIFVNDGSTDGSELIVPISDKICVLNNPKNRGKGYSLKIGFSKAIEMDFDIIVSIDADLQHDPEYIPVLIGQLKEYDFVIGNRLNNLDKMPVHRIASNKITSFLLSLKVGQKIMDSQCGFRAFRKNVLLQILPDSTGYEAETEMIIKAGKKDIKMGFADIPTIYGDEKSKMKNMSAIIGFIKVFLSN